MSEQRSAIDAPAPRTKPDDSRRARDRVSDTSSERLSAALARSQGAGLVRGDIDARATGPLLLALVPGAQTMLDLGLRLDLAGGAQVLLHLLQPPRAAEAPARSPTKSGPPRKTPRPLTFRVDREGVPAA